MASCWPLCGHVHESVLSGQWLYAPGKLWAQVSLGNCVSVLILSRGVAASCALGPYVSLPLMWSPALWSPLVLGAHSSPLMLPQPPWLPQTLALCRLLPPWHLPPRCGPESSWGPTSRDEPASLLGEGLLEAEAGGHPLTRPHTKPAGSPPSPPCLPLSGDPGVSVCACVCMHMCACVCACELLGVREVACAFEQQV